MPTHKAKGGYKWGKKGKVYPTKKQADKQGQAIYANNWKGTKINEKNMGKQIIRLTEDDLHQIIKESTKKIVVEISNSNIKKKYINKLYKATKDITSHIYKDDNWTTAFEAFDIINDVIGHDGELNVWCENGGYWKGIGEFPNYKEFKFDITLTTGIVIGGSLKCHSAGTIEDPFARYDITITFY